MVMGGEGPPSSRLPACRRRWCWSSAWALRPGCTGRVVVTRMDMTAPATLAYCRADMAAGIGGAGRRAGCPAAGVAELTGRMAGAASGMRWQSVLGPGVSTSGGVPACHLMHGQATHVVGLRLATAWVKHGGRLRAAKRLAALWCQPCTSTPYRRWPVPPFRIPDAAGLHRRAAGCPGTPC